MIHRPRAIGADGREPYLRASSLVGFADAVRRFGGDPVALTAEVGFPPSVLTDFDGLVSFTRYCRLLELTAERLDRPTFGLDWAATSHDRYAVAGPLLHLAHFVEDFDEWIESGLSFWRLHCNGIQLRVIRTEPDVVAFRCFYPYSETPPRQFTERTLGLILLLTRRVMGIEERVTIIRFQHAAPPDTTVYETLLERRVEFGAEHNELVLPVSFLARRAKGRLKFLKPLLEHYVRARIRRMPTYDQSLSATVSIAIAGALGSQKCSIDYVAGSLGYTSKKLQRQLAEEGATFSRLLEEVRHATAQRMLAESNAPIASIAALLDYSATAPFTAAFRRWTGVSPLDYRNTARAAAANPED